MVNILLLTLVIGIVNLSLGYALAAYLDLAPPTLADAWQAMVAEPPADDWTRADSEDEVDRLILQLGGQSGPPQAYACLLALGQIVVQQGDRLAAIDAQLRTGADESDRTLLHNAAREASQTCQAWLGWQRRAMDRFRECAGQSGERSSLVGEVEMAVEELSARIEELLQTQRHLRRSKAVAETARQFRDDLGYLNRTIHKSRDALAAISMATAQQSGRLSEVHDTCCTDPLTGLPNRIGLEIFVRGWWEEKRQESGPLAAALIEPDAFAECNQEHGVAAGNGILRVMAETIVGHVGPQGVAARYTGPKFLLLLPGTVLAEAAASVESLRQSLSALDHVVAEGTTRRTVSAAVVQTVPGETPESLFGRLEEELDQAKRAGGNQSHSPAISAT
jgi:diguanylate cyclase (GGDEF)-like protein